MSERSIEKAQLRRKLRAEAGRFSPAERALASTEICKRLQEQQVWKDARSILFYSSLPDEPDIQPLLPVTLAQGKIAALPRFSSEAGCYEARQICELDRDLAPGAFGIPEPGLACAIFALNKLDLVLVPGIGFTLHGLRLGRGKGYYDRLLAQTSGAKCGVAFDWQVTVEIPAELHDIRLDCILTPTRWHDTATAQA